MPYKTTNDLPENVRNVLPEHARVIYKKAFNNAYEEYKDSRDRRGGGDREQIAHKVAWKAVKTTYYKGDDDKWHPK